MAHAAPTSPLFILQLQPGRSVWEHLPRAADITVTEGSIVVHQRLLLADTWVHLPVVVRAGEQFRVGARGWMAIEAMDAAQIYGSVIQGWWQRGWLGQALRRVRPTAGASLLPTA